MLKLILGIALGLSITLAADTRANAAEKAPWFNVWNKALALSAKQNGGEPYIIDHSKDKGYMSLFVTDKGVDYILIDDKSGQSYPHSICASVGHSPMKCLNYESGATF